MACDIMDLEQTLLLPLFLNQYNFQLHSICVFLYEKVSDLTCKDDLSQSSPNKLYFAADRHYYRNPQMVKMQKNNELHDANPQLIVLQHNTST